MIETQQFRHGEAMAKLEAYAGKYKNIAFSRRDGILEVRVHSNGGPLKWGALETSAHAQLGEAFYNIGRDPDNRVVILTGTGDAFLAEFAMDELGEGGPNPQYWDRIYVEGKDLLMNLLDIPVPVIGAVNGPAFIHAELVTLSDIVIAADTASFADLAHFPGGTVPGDGVHVWWEMLLGVNRARYFLLTGQKIPALEALTLGIVSEVVPSDRLMARAWELAEQLAKQPPLVARYTRTAMTQNIKRRMMDDLGYGLMLEGMGVMGSFWPGKNAQ
jgi:enoyl-CoA hydratase/carnithine racemase